MIISSSLSPLSRYMRYSISSRMKSSVSSSPSLSGNSLVRPSRPARGPGRAGAGGGERSGERSGDRSGGRGERGGRRDDPPAIGGPVSHEPLPKPERSEVEKELAESTSLYGKIEL